VTANEPAGGAGKNDNRAEAAALICGNGAGRRTAEAAQNDAEGPGAAGRVQSASGSPAGAAIGGTAVERMPQAREHRPRAATVCRWGRRPSRQRAGRSATATTRARIGTL